MGAPGQRRNTWPSWGTSALRSSPDRNNSARPGNGCGPITKRSPCMGWCATRRWSCPHPTASNRAAALALLALKKRPTAIFAANDLSAFGVMAVLQEQGLKIAQDMSVVGFDDVPAALHVHPALTTVRQPMEGIGRAAVSTLLSQIAGLAPDSARVPLPTELIVRQSTAPPQR